MTTRRRPGWQDELSRSFSRFFSRSSSQEKEEDSAAGSKDSGGEQERGDRSASRLFFRTPSQERKESTDRTEPVEEQERGQSPSRLFFKRTPQENKGGLENAPVRGNKEEQDRSSGFSRLFSKTSSQEKEEENESSKTKGEGEDQSRCEDNSNLTVDRLEKLSEPEQVKHDQISSLTPQNMSESEEEKDREVAHNSKELDSEKQPKEKLLNFFENLFHFSPRSQGNSKQASAVQDLCKEHEDAQVKNNLDKEDLNQEQTLDVCSGTVQAAEQNTTYEEENTLDSNSGTLNEVIKQEQHEDTSPKINGYNSLNAPAITYGTYRGSRRIRKLLKRRPDVNSPIPEKEETSEKESNCIEDVDTENCCMLHQLVKMEPVISTNCEDEISPSKINIKTQSKAEDLDQNVDIRESSNTLEDLHPNAKGSSITSKDLEPQAKKSSQISENLQPSAENRSNILEDLQPSSEDAVESSNILEALQSNAKKSSNNSEDLETNGDKSSEYSEDLPPKAEESANSSEALHTNSEKSSSILDYLQPSTEGSSSILEDIKPKENSTISEDVDSNTDECSNISEDLPPNAEESAHISKDLQPTAENSSTISEVLHTNAEETLGISEGLQPSAQGNSSILQRIQPKESSKKSEDLETNNDESSNISEDLQPNSEENKSTLVDMQPNTEESLRFSGYVQPNTEERSKTLGELQPNEEESSKILENLDFNKSTKITNNIQPKTEENSADMQPKTVDITYNLESTQPLSEYGSKLSKDLQTNPKEISNIPDNLQSSIEDIIKNAADLLPKTVESVKKNENSSFIYNVQSDAEKNLDWTDRQPRPQENTVALHPNTKGNSIIGEDLKINGDENLKHLNTVLNKKLSQELQPNLEEVPKVYLDVQLNASSEIPESLQQKANDMIKEHQINAKVIHKVPEDPQLKAGEFTNFELQPKIKNIKTVSDSLKTNKEENTKTTEEQQVAEEPQVKSGIIPKINKDQQLNIAVEPNISEDLKAQAVEPPKRNVALEPTTQEIYHNSDISVDNSENVKNNSIFTLPALELEKTNPFIHLATNSISLQSQAVSTSEELGADMELGVDMITETDTSHNCLADKNKVGFEEIDGSARKFDLQPSITFDHSDNMPQSILIHDSYQDVSDVDVNPVPENYLNNISSLEKSHGTETGRTISFDNGIECRSSSPTITSDSPLSPADCSNVRCDSPLPLSDAVDSGILSSQAYTPEEHILFKTFPSEIFNKHISYPIAVDQETNIIGDIESSRDNIQNTEFLAPKPDNIAEVKRMPKLKEKQSMAHASSLAKDEQISIADSCAGNSGIDESGGPSEPHKLKSSLNSEVYVAKVSVKTVNIEEIKISPYGFLSEVIAVGKLESPTFEKELICLPNLSPPPTNTANDNTFQVLQCAREDKNVTNSEMSFYREKDVTPNKTFKYEKDPKNCFMEMENDLSAHINMLPNDYVSDSIQYTFIEKELTNTGKSSDVLKENLKNNNLTVRASDDIINGSLKTCSSESELTNQLLLSSDSQWDIGSCDSLSESNPDSEVTHREPGKLNDVLLNSALQADVNITDDMLSSGSTTPKMILPDIDHSESSNDLFQQKANEIVFTVLHSTMDELQNRNRKSLIKGKDPFVSIAEEIVNEVISSSKQMLFSNLVQNVLNKSIDTDETTQHETTNNLNQSFTDSENDPTEDTANTIKTDSLLDINNAVHLPSCEINSNILAATEMFQNATSSQTADPYSLNDLNSSVTVDMRENAENVTRESNVLTKKEVLEEHLNCSRSPCEAEINNVVNVQTDSYPTLDINIRGDLENENLKFDGDNNDYYNRQTECSSKSFETEGSMNEYFASHFSEEANNTFTSGTSSEFSDPFQFFIHNSEYVEISDSDDEFADEDKDSTDNGQASDQDLFLSVPSRRVRIYPFALSPIYEDDSSHEDALSNISSPRHNEGATSCDSGFNHTSILSLLQSVSERLKETDMGETSCEERLLAAFVNDRPNEDTSETLAPYKTNLDDQAIPEEEKTSGGTKSLFITKSFTENRPNLGRQSFLLHLSSQSNTLAKSSAETTSIPASGSEKSLSLTSESSSNYNTDLSPSTAPMNAISPLQMVTEPALSFQKSDVEPKPRLSTQSAFYQYFNAAQNSSTTPENKENQAQEKLEDDLKKTEGPQMDAADSDSLKFNPRPGKVTLSDMIDLENKIELKGDVLDATSWKFPNGVNIRVIRGCWILYEKPHFEGQAHVLEEGEAVLYHLWDLPGTTAKPDKISIGSVKRVVKDYFPVVVISSLHDTSDIPVYIRTEVPSLGNLVDKRPRSLTVISGVWLAYTEPLYNGTVTVLEEGCELPRIQDCGIKSMRALKMGGLKVQLPSDPKIIIYEKPYFQGWSREITELVCSVGTLACDGDNSDNLNIGSMQVRGGIWVGYEKEQYKGQQYLLEEGDYEDWHTWGGYGSALQSLRYLQANFLEASVTLFDSIAEDGKQVDLFNQAIPDLELAGYNPKTQSIHVKTGMWVAYQEKHFCGEQYILEKGRYKSYMDWGGSSSTIMSIRPVLLEPLGRNEVKHLIKAFDSCNFQGDSVDFTQEICDFSSFMPKSFKVLRGCWLLCYQADTCDNLCVLEEGHFPDLASCGSLAAEIKYIKPIDYVFAEPSVSLFALDSCEGRELHFEEAVTSVLSKDIHFYTLSVWIRRGLWIAFEGANFLGRQMLLDPQKIGNWSHFSGWKAIGSLRPLKQPAVYFMVKNRHKDKYLTVTGKLADTRATFVNISARNGQSTQIWYFCRGLLKSKANDSCLDVIGGRNVPGSKVSLWTEHGKSRQKWKINKDGTIASYISDDLLLDLKGGNYYDQNYVLVNRAQESALTQKWDIEIL
ncbi:very large A-kinase anchor protein [Mixophyes fleayi]|uniref:very large A-kinase anchor protein n=1 Tax=Mixophyes fleayi TaxID=3061075 RepID=UPI003F4DEACB